MNGVKQGKWHKLSGGGGGGKCGRGREGKRED